MSPPADTLGTLGRDIPCPHCGHVHRFCPVRTAAAGPRQPRPAGMRHDAAAADRAPDRAAATTAPLGPNTAADSKPGRTMIELSSSDPEHVRKLNKPEPNATVIVDGRFRYETDERGRVTKATTTLDVIDLKHPRSKHAQRTLSDKLPGDDAGHLFARTFKGPGQKLNLVPMEALGVNRGEYKSLEAAWRSALEDDREVEVSIELSYDGPTRRPDSIYVTYDDGIKKRSVFIENEPQGGSE